MYQRSLLIIFISSLLCACGINAQAECTLPDNYTSIAFTAIDDENYDVALAIFDCAIERDLDSAQNYFYRGGTYFLMEDFETAIVDYDLAIALIDENSDLYLNILGSRSVAYYFLGQFDTAIVELTFVIENSSFSAEQLLNIYTSRAGAQYFQGNLDEALSDYNILIEIDNTNAVFFASRGLIHHHLGNESQARLDGQQAFDLNPDYTDAMREGVDQQIRYELYSPALISINDIILLDTYHENTSLENNYLRSRIHLELGNNIESISDANIVIAGGQNGIRYPDIYLIRATAHYNANFLDLALADVNQYIQLISIDSSGYLLRGNIYFDQENFEEALADYITADEISRVPLEPEIQARIDELQS